MGNRLVRVEDARGSIEMEWLTEEAFHLQAHGEVSSELGIEGAARLAVMLADAERFACFVDLSEPGEVDFTAATAFLRIFLEKKEKLECVVLRVRSGAAEPMQRIISDLLDGRLEVVVDAAVFKRRMAERTEALAWEAHVVRAPCLARSV